MKFQRTLVQRSIKLLTAGDKRNLLLLCAGRAAASLLDILGLLLIGFAASMLTGAVGRIDELKKSLPPLVPSQWLDSYASIAVVAIVFFIFKSIVSTFLNRNLVDLGSRVEANNSSRIFEAVLRDDLDGAMQVRTSDLLFALNRSSHVAFSQSVVTVGTLVSEFSLVVLISIYLFLLSPSLFMMMMAYLVAFALLLHFSINKRISKFAAGAVSAGNDSQEIAMDALANLRQIKSLGRDLNFSRKFLNSRIHQSKQLSKVVSLGYLPRYLTEIVLMLGLGGLLLERTLNGSHAIDPSVVAVFIAGALRLTASMVPLQSALSTLAVIEKEGALALDLLQKSLKLKPAPPLKELANFDIEFDEVSYLYGEDSSASLRPTSIKVPFGTTLLVTGRSGAGKSTFADLLLGLRQPSTGSVTIGGNATHDLASNQTHLFGYVSQQVSLIHGSLAENVTLGKDTGHTDADIIEVLKICGLKDLLSELPRGIHTHLGSNGRQLSGGQVQRLGLARALLNKPKILVLDEATSALDLSSREEVEDVLRSLSGTLTIVYISHQRQIPGLSAAHLVLRDS